MSLDKFVIRSKRSLTPGDSSSNVPNQSISSNAIVVASNVRTVRDESNDIRGDKRARTDSTCEWDIISDPGLRKPINEYEPRVRDDVMRAYVVKGACQPLSHKFPKTLFGKKMRSFRAEWYKNWEWLEYSVSKDAAFCFWCYLFHEVEGRRFGDDVFVRTGFRNWKKSLASFRDHVGIVKSAHNNARIKFFAFRNQKQSLPRCVASGIQTLGAAYRTRLNASVDCARFLIAQGLAFRGHDERETSLNKGNFLELLDWYSARNVEVSKVVKDNAPSNHQLTCPKIQKDIISSCASETLKVIISDIGDKFFSLLIDEARDNSVKEQMAIVVRYVNDNGVVIERFLGVKHVVDTTALSLKSDIDEFFAKHGLSLSKIRGQGYDGASNMRGELSGLKTLILNENPHARYIHCFAHQLQLVVVAVAQSNKFVSDFFEYLSMITNMVGSSCKRKDEFRQKQHEAMVEMLEKGELTTGRGLNQESSLARPGATRWGSHHTTIIRILSMWSPTIQVLDNIFDDGTDLKSRGSASSLVDKMESYQFVFIAQLMKKILGLTNILSHFLQQKDQNILEAVSLVKSTKAKFQDLRESGWDGLLEDVSSFCVKNKIDILNMEETNHRSRRVRHPVTNYHHFRVDIFCQVIDQISLEMENRFSESNTELLSCLACLDPRDKFSNFCESKLLNLAELYSCDFSSVDRMEVKEQLQVWIYEMRTNELFSDIQTIGEVCKKMVELKVHNSFHLIYRLIELTLVLPVATATVERAFSAMNIIKTDLRNKMGDDYLTDCLVCYIDSDVFRSIDNETIMQHFQNMKTRRLDLPKLQS
ncbi:unnamed protein product [Cuscuta epithymum]|uniref:TTF-type domain-containing protein n=4 Tax=Cuscuta epithymum TaxID=186058 RepID=A0AAV0BX11_9ASTE|nr:unnamed protein product [Cuscuta epithymum]